MSILVPVALCFIFAGQSPAQLQFIENKGQWDNRFDYKSDFNTGSFYVQKNGFTVLMHHEADLENFAAQMHGHAHNDAAHKEGAAARVAAPPVPVFSEKLRLRSHAYRVVFLGATGKAAAVPDKPLPTYNNYFIGKDSSRWKSNCAIYQAITYKNVYPNIDVRYYTDQGTLKYDIIVHPGGNPNEITLQYQGVDKLEVKNKELVATTSVGTVKELYPYTYQVLEKGREVLDCKYQVKDNTVRFKVSGYTPGATLVIDPTLIFSSFAGSTSDNWGYTATPGPDGSFFAGGISFGDGFPVSPGAYDRTYNGGINEDGNGPYDISIIKLSANGTSRIYATYLGGTANEQPHSMICDAEGNLIVAGRTNSSNYPLTQSLIGSGGNYDIVITKLNAAGTALIGSVKIGGTADDGINIKSKYSPVNPPSQNDGAYDTRRNYGDDARSEVIIDAAGNIYMAGCTQSSNFPTTPGVFQPAFGGGPSTGPVRQDGVVLKFNPNLSQVLFSSFFGGAGNDACFVLSINPANGNVYVAGGTTSNNLPGSTANTISTSYQGGVTDGFVTIIRPDGSAIVSTTYIGTTGNDLVYGIKFDRFGYPYVNGTTTGNWPVINASFSNAGGKQFICKLQSDLSAYVYSTVFGTNSGVPNISPTAFLVDRCENVYVSGWGGTFNNGKGYPNAGTSGLPVTPNAVQSVTDGSDFYFFVLEKDAASQLFGSFFGQRNGFNDHVDGGTSRFDENGIIYQSLCANCGNTPGVFFPTTPGVWAPSNRSINCAMACVKIEMNFGGVGASVKATVNGIVDTIGCVPLDIVFTDTLAKGKRYIWHFGDGTPSETTIAPVNSVSHTYTAEGLYRLMLVSIDSTTCNIADTAYVNVRVGNNIITPRFTAIKQPPCTNLTYNFVNTTTASRPAYSNNTFTWDFGDGSPRIKTGFQTVSHTYASVGNYKVTLLVDDTTFCNVPDSFSLNIRLAIVVTAEIGTPENACVGKPIAFQNNTLGGLSFVWNFGDGSPQSTEIDPVHIYNQPGRYQVTLIANDSTTCNLSDTARIFVDVFAIPVANFNYTPQPAEENRPAQFINSSIGATSYNWSFGDGEFSTLPNPTHQYNATGVYEVCLIATNAAGCSDTICKPVEAKVLPLLDVPNAFTPGKFGVNSVIKVTGFGIVRMTWRIYNRWGQLVFETNNRKDGWDGTFKGVVQPMDVYTYTLDVELSDGEKVRKTGDITLLR
ncbi:MAG TPA: PKD domain-containing protein [Ferruginibacter sp.]|nr:PKD domain-containing protein [Ferruginibacter sp.]HMP21327.1 PKD domain-containing protein [Ferruginibacter sp.]